MGGRVTNFTWKSWFLAKKLKKIEKKKLKKIEKNASKASCWVPLTWLEHAQDMSRTCPGHGRTHEDSYGFLKIQNRTKTHQDTDIFVLQIAEQKFQISSHFATKAASKIEPLCSLDMTRTWQDTCGVIGVYIDFTIEFSYFGNKRPPNPCSPWNFDTAIYDWNMT